MSVSVVRIPAVLLVAIATGLFACGQATRDSPGEPLGTRSAAIDGTSCSTSSSFGAVGELHPSSALGEICTGTRIGCGAVLTAWHCPSMGQFIGSSTMTKLTYVPIPSGYTAKESGDAYDLKDLALYFGT